ncbi:MAG: triphosphoribosyl-dephospho-CoA synthase MdcB [Vicinamibacteraceae bacterium]
MLARWAARRIGALAMGSLHAEVMLSPKPGLVSPVDSGSHADMDVQTFMRSLTSLRGYFVASAAHGARDVPLRELQQLGVRAEAAMLAATRGVNTHRGAIFTLGLLAAAAGWAGAHGQQCSGRRLGEVVVRLWGTALREAPGDTRTHGALAAAKYGAGGARLEAASGFPALVNVGVPALRQARRAGMDRRRASVQALFSLMAVLQDTNLLHRGGTGGLQLAQNRARAFLAGGGVLQPDWEPQVQAIHQELVRHRLSPGGSADLLAASCFVLALREEAKTGARRSAVSGAGCPASSDVG